MLFLDLAPPRYKIPEFFTIAPVLTSTLTVCRRNRGDPSSLYAGLRVRYKYYRKHSRYGLARSRPRADCGLSRHTSVFHTTIQQLYEQSRSVEIWQYEGQKPIFEQKQRTAKHGIGRQ